MSTDLLYAPSRPVRFVSTSCPLFLKFPLFRSFVGVKWRDPEPLCRNANVIHSHSSCGPRPLVILYLSLSDSFCCFCLAYSYFGSVKISLGNVYGTVVILRSRSRGDSMGHRTALVDAVSLPAISSSNFQIIFNLTFSMRLI